MTPGPAITGSKAGLTIAVMCASLMAVLDISIVNVALADIRASFGSGLDEVGWISIGYMMANVVVIPITGWLQRRFGCRAYYAGSVLLFTAASALCSLAWDLPSLVAFRVLQGLGGGAIIPTSQALLFARYPREEHTMAGALFGIGAMSGPLLGPTVGGYLIDLLSWHWIFLINVPFGLLSAALAWRSIREPGWQPSREPIDLGGLVLLTGGLSSFQYVAEEGNRAGWWESRRIVLLSALSLVCLVTFVVHELEIEQPMVDFRVFKSASYAGGTGINFLVGIALFAGSYLFSLYCGVVMRYSARDTGLVFLTAGGIQLVVMMVLGRIGPRLDGRWVVAGGILAMGLSLWMNGHLTNQGGFWDLARPQMIRSLGMGCVFIPLTVITLSDLPAAQRGNAAGLFNLTRELGGSIGIAWMGTVLERRDALYTAVLGEHVSRYSALATEQLGALQQGLGPRLYSPLEGSLALLRLRVGLQGLVRSFNDAFLLMCAVFLCGLLLVLFLKLPRPGAEDIGAGAH